MKLYNSEDRHMRNALRKDERFLERKVGQERSQRIIEGVKKRNEIRMSSKLESGSKGVKDMNGKQRHESELAPSTKGRTWDRGVSFYDTFVRLWLLGKDSELRETTVEMAGIEPGDIVLDAGCGTGRLTLMARVIAGTQGEVYGIDGAPRMIEVAKRNAVKAGTDVRFSVALIEDIPFPDAQFDVVLSSLVLHHLPDDVKRKGFKEAYRVLKPGGRFLAVDLSLPIPLGHDRRISSIAELHDIAELAGFEDIKVGQTRMRRFSFVLGRKDSRGSDHC
ncbi:MAG: class I SAM-dependent methyltransferase [Actinomycetota bacterium]